MKLKKLLLILIAFGLCACSSPVLPDKEAAQPVVIYLVRHGKTWFNTTGQVQGWSDTPLTEEGQHQADAVGIGLKDVEFVAAYTSDLGRVRETAARILAENTHDTPELFELTGLREWTFGGYEGRNDAEMWGALLDTHGLGEFNPALMCELLGSMTNQELADEIAANDELHAAETYDEIASRTETAINQIIEECKALGGGNVLVVSSGGAIRTILNNIDPERTQLDDVKNCSVTQIIIEGDHITLADISNTSYLETGLEALNK